MSKRKIQIYTGNGKGKTTASLGLAIRALGNKMKVGIIFFDKGGNFYNERKILDKLNIEYKSFGLVRMNKKGFRFKNTKEDILEVNKGLEYIKECYKKDFDILILDEINTTIKNKLLEEDKIIEIIKNKPKKLELILTGRYCTDKIIELGDLVTEMKEIKHYSHEGIKARQGIEY